MPRGLVNPTGIFERGDFVCAHFTKALEMIARAVGVNGRNVHQKFHRHDEHGENQARDDEGDCRAGSVIDAG